MKNDEEVSESLKGLVELFNIKDKRDVEKHCRNLVITQKDLVGIILVGEAGLLEGYLHARYHVEITPEHLKLNDKDHKAIQSNEVGALKPDAKKAFNKVMQIFKDRKLWSIHLFYSPRQINLALILF